MYPPAGGFVAKISFASFASLAVYFLLTAHRSLLTAHRYFRAPGERQPSPAGLYSSAMIMMPHIAPLPLPLRWMWSGKLYTTPTVLSSGEGLGKNEFCRGFVQFCAGHCAPFCSRRLPFFSLPTAYCQLPTAYCQLPTAYCQARRRRQDAGCRGGRTGGGQGGHEMISDRSARFFSCPRYWFIAPLGRH